MDQLQELAKKGALQERDLSPTQSQHHDHSRMKYYKGGHGKAHHHPHIVQRHSLEKVVPEIAVDEEPVEGEYISKNGVSFRHQKPSQFRYPKQVLSTKVDSERQNEDDLQIDFSPTAAQIEVSSLIQRV